MALPPPYLSILEALIATENFDEPERAVEIVKYFEARGWRLVPSYAVDESRIPRVQFWPDDEPPYEPPYDVEAGLTRLWAEVVEAEHRKAWCPECETSPGECPPGTCPGRPEPQIEQTKETE